VASANCARYCGADVDFVDIDPRTYNMSPEALETKLRAAGAKGRLPKIVIPVHFAGQSCDMSAIAELGRRYGFHLIEDASHAVGGLYQGAPVGNGRFSEVTVFSFHPVKIITTGEGGLALTNNRDLAERMRLLRSHGVTREPEFMTRESDGPWYYQQVYLGCNYRLTDFQTALGLSQLTRLDQYLDRRHQLAERYDRLLADLPIILPYQAPDTWSAFHLYPVKIDRTRTRRTRAEVFAHLRTGGVGVNVHYIPIHTQPYYQRLGFKPGDFPEAEAYYVDTLSLPMFYALTDAEQNRVVELLREILS
jgi:dTDP-4-amino-4,6-dideoxygalactose transaminase